MAKGKKDFDCVKIKHAIQKKMYEETKKMSIPEFMNHVSKAIQKGHFAEKIRRLQSRQEKKQKA